ncbi:hypothetical protein PVAP13_9KG152285 [Panicum virgatum]|uniref:Uncharacterized protein n=1 Tax=Panicum virgatum TaxID=38727 RepID=A0A8T0NDY7_PANVG|nr:hypothetical protein PVAP13_9KG152285 [Panicum virgatum]
MEGVLPAAGGAHQRGWLGAAVGTPCSRRSSSSVSGARPRAAAPRGRRSLATRPAALPCSTAELARAAGSEPPTEHGRTASRRDQRRLHPRGRPCCLARRRCSPPHNSTRPAVLACERWHLAARRSSSSISRRSSPRCLPSELLPCCSSPAHCRSSPTRRWLPWNSIPPCVTWIRVEQTSI